MKKLYPIIGLLLLLIVLPVHGQDFELTNQVNGTYHLFEAERGVNNKLTKTKLIEYGENNGTKLLAIAACEKCMPAVYTYKKEKSKELKRKVFYNSSGIWVMEYDADSFVLFMSNPNAIVQKDDLLYSNFYSKSESKVRKMSKKKVEDFIINL